MSSVPDSFSQARAAYERGQHARVRELLATQPPTALSPQLLLMLGNSAIALGDDALALQALGYLHSRQPHPGIARTLAGLHNRAGAYASALELVNRQVAAT